MSGLDTALHARVRLARNYSDLPFDLSGREKDAAACIARTQNALQLSGTGEGYLLYRLRDMAEPDIQALAERHYISQDLIRRRGTAAVLLNEQRAVSVMINEEDHLRILALAPGDDLAAAAQKCFQVEDALSGQTSFAFDPQLGYLTAYPTNTGTGLRASILLHLPLLTQDKQMGTVGQMAAKVGLTVRGVFGEGSEALGSLYLVSNHATLGRTEEEILDTVRTVAQQLGQMERAMRERFLREQRVTLLDRIGRAWGILRNARLLETKEFLRYWSLLRLGVEADQLPCTLPLADALLEHAQDGHLQADSAEPLTAEGLQQARADCARHMLEDQSEIEV